MVGLIVWVTVYVTVVQTLVLVPLNFGHNSWLVYKARILELTTVDHYGRVITVTLATIVT